MGGKSSTTSSSSSANPLYEAAYSNVLGQAQNVASTPYNPYGGQVVADLAPQQTQGIGQIASSPNVQAPYLNTAADLFNTAAGTNLEAQADPYINSATKQYQASNNINFQNALGPYQSSAASGFAQGAAPVTAQQYSPDALQQYISPYTQNVVNATQAQFNNQNQQQQSQLQGNAASQGALGGDRMGVAQAQLAGQQQASQAPQIANLYNQGFANAQQEFNTQQQTNLTAQEQSRQNALAGAQGTAGLAGQSLTASQAQAANLNAIGQGYLAEGNTRLGAAQSQGWLGEQAASGYAGLGNEALNGTLSSGSALLNAGAVEQNQAQNQLNVPYQQYLAAQSYPFQTTSWLSNIAQGLGGASGGTSSTTQPGPSAVSQVLGLGLAGAGIYGASGGFSGSGSSAASPSYWDQAGAYQDATGYGFGGAIHRAAGGPVQGFASGGIPNLAEGLGSSSSMPGGMPVQLNGIPDMSVSVVPGAQGMSVPSTNHGTPNILKSNGTTTKTSGGDGVFGEAAHLGGTLLGASFGGPGGAMAANLGLNALGVNRGGAIGRADGGGVSVNIKPTGIGGSGVPQMAVANGGMPSDLAAYLARQAPYMPPAAKPAGAPAATPMPPGAAMGAQSQSVPADVGQGMTSPWQGAAMPGVTQGQQVSDFDRGIISKFGGLGFQQPSSYNARGGRLQGFADGGSPDPDNSSDDLNTLPVPPIPPSLGAPPPPPPASAAKAAPSGNGMTAVKDLGDLSGKIRDVPNSANPWLALMTAGFATAAGKSPFALENIGQGGLAGSQEYISSDKAAKDLASRVDQARAGLALSQARGVQEGAFQQGNLDLGNKKVDQEKILSEEQMANQTKIAGMHDATERSVAGMHVGAQMQIAKMNLGMEGARLAETAREHDIMATPEDVRAFKYYQALPADQQDKYQTYLQTKKGMIDIFDHSGDAGTGITPPGGMPSPSLPPAQMDQTNAKAGPIPTASAAADPTKVSAIIPAGSDKPQPIPGSNTDTSGRNEAYLASLKPQFQNQVKALVEGRMQMPARPSPMQQQLILAAGQYDPSFDTTDWGKRAQTAKDFAPGGKDATNVTAINTAMNHMSALQDRMGELNNGKSPALNAIKNWWDGTVLGQSGPNDAATVRDSVASELRKVFSGASGGTLEELKQWEQHFPVNGSPEQITGALHNAIELMDGRLTTLAQQQSNGMGVNRQGTDLLTPEARTAYQKLTGSQPVSGTPRPPVYSGAGPSGQRPMSAPVDRMGQPPPASIDYLRQNPGLRTAFDQKYGQGASDRYLGQ